MDEWSEPPILISYVFVAVHPALYGLQVQGITDAGLKPRQIKVIAVLGGGLMGSGIATAAALAGMEVLLKEINQKFLDVRRYFSRPCRPAASRNAIHLVYQSRVSATVS